MHFFDTKRTFYFGNVEIGDNCFIGINTLICKPVKIVSNCIVEGGGTTDLPDNVFAGGIPCKIIKTL